MVSWRDLGEFRAAIFRRVLPVKRFSILESWQSRILARKFGGKLSAIFINWDMRGRETLK